LITRPLLLRLVNFWKADFVFVEAATIIVAAKITNQLGIEFNTATARVSSYSPAFVRFGIMKWLAHRGPRTAMRIVISFLTKTNLVTQFAVMTA
jgi:hypothetical protein